jgi:hypothetical protein
VFGSRARLVADQNRHHRPGAGDVTPIEAARHHGPEQDVVPGGDGEEARSGSCQGGVCRLRNQRRASRLTRAFQAQPPRRSSRRQRQRIGASRRPGCRSPRHLSDLCGTIETLVAARHLLAGHVKWPAAIEAYLAESRPQTNTSSCLRFTSCPSRQLGSPNRGEPQISSVPCSRWVHRSDRGRDERSPNCTIDGFRQVDPHQRRGAASKERCDSRLTRGHFCRGGGHSAVGASYSSRKLTPESSPDEPQGGAV